MSKKRIRIRHKHESDIEQAVQARLDVEVREKCLEAWERTAELTQALAKAKADNQELRIRIEKLKSLIPGAERRTKIVR